MLIPDPRRTPLPNLISHNGIILYQWEFLRARLDEGEGLPWIAMDMVCAYQVTGTCSFACICFFRGDCFCFYCHYLPAFDRARARAPAAPSPWRPPALPRVALAK